MILFLKKGMLLTASFILYIPHYNCSITLENFNFNRMRLLKLINCKGKEYNKNYCINDVKLISYATGVKIKHYNEVEQTGFVSMKLKHLYNLPNKPPPWIYKLKLSGIWILLTLQNDDTISFLQCQEMRDSLNKFKNEKDNFIKKLIRFLSYILEIKEKFDDVSYIKVKCE